MKANEVEIRIREFETEFNETFDILKMIHDEGCIFNGGQVPVLLRNLQCCHDAQLHWRNCLAAIERDRRKKNGKTI